VGDGIYVYNVYTHTHTIYIQRKRLV